MLHHAYRHVKFTASVIHSEPLIGSSDPLPPAVSDEQTTFLALDQVSPERQFLELVEIPGISDQPLRYRRLYLLEYDNEWLAITRACAGDSVLGSGGPASEEWVERDLTIPTNFVWMAPPYDQLPTNPGMPAEYQNPRPNLFAAWLESKTSSVKTRGVGVAVVVGGVEAHHAHADAHGGGGIGDRGGGGTAAV
jgi:lariat debranching enzyme